MGQGSESRLKCEASITLLAIVTNRNSIAFVRLDTVAVEFSKLASLTAKRKTNYPSQFAGHGKLQHSFHDFHRVLKAASFTPVQNG
jgi:hypothetical protein